MIYQIRQNCLRPWIAPFHFYRETYTTLSFPLSTRKIESKREENKIDFSILRFCSEVHIYGTFSPFIERVFEFKSN